MVIRGYELPQDALRVLHGIQLAIVLHGRHILPMPTYQPLHNLPLV
jgi:hypothetical protein